jgi:nucleotide-binding universal stress UspA family protein
MVTRSFAPGPTPLRQIILGTDFSAGAQKAARRIPYLPLAAGASVTVVHVLPGGIPPHLLQAVRSGAEARLAEETRALGRALRRRGLKEATVQSQLRSGKPFRELVACAEEVKAALIVVGRHGKDGMQSLLLGSTAERVVRNGQIPVLVVAAEARAPYTRPVVALEGEEDGFLVEAALGLLLPKARRLDVVAAYQVPFEGWMRAGGLPPQAVQQLRNETRDQHRRALEQLVAARCPADLACRVTVRRGDPRQEILTLADRRRAELIVVGSHGRRGLAHVLLGSVSEGVLRAAKKDVLVARTPGAKIATTSAAA